jgi:hypothetical protein
MSDATGLRVASNAWVGALSAANEDNWRICVERGLWGSGSHRARQVREGDEFFVWKSGKGGGWFARCLVTSDALAPSTSNPAPWKDGRDYKYIFGIRVLAESTQPFHPGSTDDIQNITGIYNIMLGQFPLLSDAQAEAVRRLIGGVNPPSEPEDEAKEAENDAHEDELRQRPLLGAAQRKQLILARRGQGVFRSNLMTVEKSCRVTGLRAVEHLRASHIKPWRASDDREKVDGYNGLMLSPHIDHLFDRGWITFLDEGHLKPSPRLDALVLQSWRVEPDRNPPPFKGEQQVYLQYHRELVFKS